MHDAARSAGSVTLISVLPVALNEPEILLLGMSWTSMPLPSVGTSYPNAANRPVQRLPFLTVSAAGQRDLPMNTHHSNYELILQDSNK